MKKLLWMSLALGAMVVVGCSQKGADVPCNKANCAAKGMKCGAAMKKMPKSMKCGAGKCGNAMKEAPKTIKCGSGKCGDAMKEAPKSMKCGKGKCGNK